MMTITARINATSAILNLINRDLANRPAFTLTREQLDSRIRSYLDCPHTDDDFFSIAATLTKLLENSHTLRD